MPGPPFSPWDRSRALLLAAVIAVNGLAALRMPARLTERSLEDPVMQEELASWTAFLQGLGLELSQAELVGTIRPLSQAAHQARDAVLDPLDPVFRVLGTRQGWGVFGTPDTWPHALVILGREAEGPWTTLYRSLDREHRWARSLLRYRRIRAVYAPGRSRPAGWDEFVRWIAGRAFADHPQLGRVRVYAERARIRLPGEAVEPTVKRRFSRTLRREELLP